MHYRSNHPAPVRASALSHDLPPRAIGPSPGNSAHPLILPDLSKYSCNTLRNRETLCSITDVGSEGDVSRTADENWTKEGSGEQRQPTQEKAMESTHITALQSKHAGLDRELRNEQARPAPDSARIQELKRAKLKIKEAISLH
ncbi:YdcH family protein [Croceicoccus gelatinilyticus]|uniref:YdcH family protein n=1 Tax=Croceicoccus gelatinilyticus TaxID=2835536 RepID=UPI00307FF688